MLQISAARLKGLLVLEEIAPLLSWLGVPPASFGGIAQRIAKHEDVKLSKDGEELVLNSSMRDIVEAMRVDPSTRSLFRPSGGEADSEPVDQDDKRDEVSPDGLTEQQYDRLPARVKLAVANGNSPSPQRLEEFLRKT